MLCRPTSGLVRGAMFDIAGDRTVIDGLVWDLCSGTGAIGLEALSRGAASCVFIDRNRKATALTRSFLKEHSALDSAIILTGNITDLAPPEGPAPDLVFIDPPYADHSLYRWVWSIDWESILSPGGVVFTEGGDSSSPDDWETRKYGDSDLSWKRVCDQ